MNEASCKERFYRLVQPSQPNEWEVDDLLRRLAALAPRRQELLLRQVPAIWPVSHSLCLDFLEAGSCREVVPDRLMGDWVRAILNSYERDGLTGARGLLADGGASFLASLAHVSAATFERVSPWLGLFLQGLCTTPIALGVQSVATTDTATVFLPPALDIFPDYRTNVVFYKFLAALHVGFIGQGTFRLTPGPDDLAGALKRFGSAFPKDANHLTLPEYFALFPLPGLAADLFFIAECQRVMHWMEDALPGLARQRCQLLTGLADLLPPEPSEIGRVVGRQALEELQKTLDNRIPWPGTSLPYSEGPASIAGLVDRYARIAPPTAPYRRPRILDMLGRHDFQGVAVQQKTRRLEVQEAFVLQLARLVGQKRTTVEQVVEGGGDRADNARIMLTEAGARHDRQLVLQIDNEHCELPDELQRLASEIRQDLGGIPEPYISAAVGVAGGAESVGTGGGEAGPVERKPGARLVDEWDYRRNGYRKNWCAVYEKELPLVRSTFVETTLQTYRGLLLRLRRQFEMMRTDECFVGRQREGDELDLDAAIEARADRRAGTISSDRLFVRLVRDERDLATLFLVDMSNSTEGWVGLVIKEALVLLCETMAVVGDRYGIYGFSGMRRSRCELFPIKRMTEPYQEPVARRIGSIGPREYTRLGPAIRAGSDILRRCEARTRLLVTITDGKPEDYDDYKGDYAVEDTRKALLEARGGGLHTFGITVDHRAHDYLPHMFGSGNYLVIDDIGKLPLRMVEMYRLLTS